MAFNMSASDPRVQYVSLSSKNPTRSGIRRLTAGNTLARVYAAARNATSLDAVAKLDTRRVRTMTLDVRRGTIMNMLTLVALASMPALAANSDVARATLDGIEAGEEDIFPDPMAQQLYSAWRQDHKAVERQLAAM
jgi:hypothetical protein